MVQSIRGISRKMSQLYVEICTPRGSYFPDEEIFTWEQLGDFCRQEAHYHPEVWFNITKNTYEGLRLIGIIIYQDGKLVSGELL